MPQITEQAFESVIEDHLLTNGYVAIDRAGFDADCGLCPNVVLTLDGWSPALRCMWLLLTLVRRR